MPTAEPDPSAGDLTTLAVGLRQATMRLAREIRGRGTASLAPHQFSVLAHLERAPRTARELADAERVSPPAMHRTVSALVDRGYVDRTADPDDGRCVILGLTSDGRSALATARTERSAWLHTKLERLSPQERELLAAATTVLAKVAAE